MESPEQMADRVFDETLLRLDEPSWPVVVQQLAYAARFIAADAYAAGHAEGMAEGLVLGATAGREECIDLVHGAWCSVEAMQGTVPGIADFVQGQASGLKKALDVLG